MNLKRLITNLFIIPLLVICNGCKNKEENTFIYKNFYEQDISTFNYIITNEHSDYTHIANFVDGLVENDKYGNIVPSIAKLWKNEIINGKQVWTFYLRENVYWVDYKGKTYDIVTAHDFVTTIKYILNYNTKSKHTTLPSSLLENGLNYYNATLVSNYNYNDILTKIENLKINDPNGELPTYNKIKNAFDYCFESNCSSDFESVGIKAIGDFELQFTLEYPSPYFLSALTYCSFLPISERFIKEVGFNNFGTNKKHLLYNGAYILKDYFHSSKIEYVKNKNYWDKDNVFIDKIIFSKLINYPTASYTRLAYETGNIDGFYVNPSDSSGWTKYVTGKNNEGSISSPIGNNTYLIEEITDYTSYHLIFNQNRTESQYTTLTKEEINISNQALSNNNFRKALIYGLKNNSYSISYINEISSTIVPSTFIYNGTKDYHTYFLEEYAKNKGISYEDALNKKNSNDLIFNADLSKYYLATALDELNISKENLPIKLEYSYFYSQDYERYNESKIKEWNNILNGCSIDSQNCNYDKILIVNNKSLSSYNDFIYAIKNGEYNISLLGLYPNFIDPTAYLEVFGSLGELSPFLNHSTGHIVDSLLDIIKTIYKEEDLDLRYTLCAELEYKIIFELALALPLCIKDTTNKILVSNLMPYQRMKSNYGLSQFKFKLRKLKEKDFTQQDILKLKEEYEKGRLQK